MNIEQLLKGVVVVIDDEIDKQGANIERIISQLNEKRYPVLKSKRLDEIDVTKLGNIAFLLLDWDLGGNLLDDNEIINGVNLSGLRNKYIVENIEFIREFLKYAFCPIFIFSNHDVNKIKNALIEENIINENSPSCIFIKSKHDIENRGILFAEIESWLKSTPSMYVLKKWEIEHQKAIVTFFNDFQKFSPFWPLILWDCFKKDDANPSLEISELLTRNLHNRMQPFQFCEEILINKDIRPKKEEIRAVLEGERFLPISRLNANDVWTGDLFKINNSYYLNIRPQCDLQRCDDVIIYCVKGTVITKKKEKENYLPAFGQFKERIDMEIIPFINKGKILSFCFKDFSVKKFNDIKANRIGRLLPPYITRIQQRFALYLQRQGLPRIPVEAIEDIEEGKT
jgi:hypothetical protein